MTRWIKHPRRLKHASCDDDERAELPAASRIAYGEEEARESEGAQPFQSHWETSWMRPVLIWANRHEDEGSEKQPGEGTDVFGH